MTLGAKDPVSRQRRRTTWQAVFVAVVVLVALFVIYRALTME